MDERMYIDLRTRLRDGIERDTRNEDFLISFIRSVEHRVNQLAGRQNKRVCRAGSMTGPTFIPGQYDCVRSTVGFTLQVEFHNAKNETIYIAEIPFTSFCDSETFWVRCTSTGEEVEQPRALAPTEPSQLAVANLLDKALADKVESFLRG